MFIHKNRIILLFIRFSYNFLGKQTEGGRKKERKKTYRIGIGTEQLYGSLDELVPRGNVNHCARYNRETEKSKEFAEKT